MTRSIKAVLHGKQRSECEWVPRDVTLWLLPCLAWITVWVSGRKTTGFCLLLAGSSPEFRGGTCPTWRRLRASPRAGGVAESGRRGARSGLPSVGLLRDLPSGRASGKCVREAAGVRHESEGSEAGGVRQGASEGKSAQFHRNFSFALFYSIARDLYTASNTVIWRAALGLCENLCGFAPPVRFCAEGCSSAAARLGGMLLGAHTGGCWHLENSADCLGVFPHRGIEMEEPGFCHLLV